MGRAQEASPRPAPPAHPLVWDAPLKRLKMEGMARMAEFTFWVTNASSTNVTVFRTETTCDCTAADLPPLPWDLKPGDSGSLKARINTTGKFGWVTNRIGLVTSHGPQILTVVAEIPVTPAPFNVPARERDRMIAQADRQAVFRNTSCAACHALPALGKTGAELFATACAICHGSERRAEMVPDLTALDKPTDAAYWREWITRGKTNSLMPAFAQAEGGILNDAQIESPVEYLTTNEPFKK
jgi:mono/diheme cytochrome c family protein